MVELGRIDLKGAGHRRGEQDGLLRIRRRRPAGTQTDALGSVTTYTYDVNGDQLSQSTTVTGPTGPHTVLTSSQYDSSRHVIAVIDAEGRTTRTEYNALASRSATTDALGRETHFVYDTRGQLVETIFPDSTPNDLLNNPRTRPKASWPAPCWAWPARQEDRRHHALHGDPPRRHGRQHPRPGQAPGVERRADQDGLCVPDRREAVAPVRRDPRRKLAGDGDDGEEATEFYRQNREAMDAGP